MPRMCGDKPVFQLDGLDLCQKEYRDRRPAAYHYSIESESESDDGIREDPIILRYKEDFARVKRHQEAYERKIFMAEEDIENTKRETFDWEIKGRVATHEISRYSSLLQGLTTHPKCDHQHDGSDRSQEPDRADRSLMLQYLKSARAEVPIKTNMAGTITDGSLLDDYNSWCEKHLGVEKSWPMADPGEYKRTYAESRVSVGQQTRYSHVLFEK